MKENFQPMPRKMAKLTKDMSGLNHRVAEVLYEHAGKTLGARNPSSKTMPMSSVLVPLQAAPDGGDPRLILNKRSQKVRQPGDLCFPGGGPELPLDGIIAQALGLSRSPLTRWPFWDTYKRRSWKGADDIALVLATGLRESLEEMNLFPFGVQFLGPLPAQQLVMFDRRIQPMVVWVESDQPFHTNWEVQRVIPIPLRDLLDPGNYCAYHIVYTPRVAARLGTPSQVFPVFRFDDGNSVEILWGVTFRIVQSFLNLVFEYDMPPMDALPLVPGTLGMEYYTGTS